MKFKNFNPIERHVEKITLAVAAAAAGYMIYLSLQPLTLPGTSINVVDVEDKVDAEVRHLQMMQTKTKDLKEIKVTLENYASQYRKLMAEQPLAAPLLDPTSVPRFLPSQVPVKHIDTGLEPIASGNVITPDALPPIEMTAKSWRGTVMVGVPTAAPTPGVPVTGPMHDQDLVVIQGRLPLDEFFKEMTDPAKVPNPRERLTGDFVRTVVYRVEAERRIRTNDGWGDWQAVPASKASAAPPTVPDWSAIPDANLHEALDKIKGGFRSVAQPDSYVTADGQPVLSLLLSGDAQALVAPPASGTTPPQPGTAMAETTTPFWLCDDSVQGGQEYQYRVRVVMYNPTYRWPNQMKDPAKRDEPLLYSAWALVPNSVAVDADMYFYVIGSLSGGVPVVGQRISAQVFKWTSGKWLFSDTDAQPGMPINATMKLPPDAKASMPVVTGYTVIDVVPNRNNTNVEAVILTPMGELITRDAQVERLSTQYKELLSKVWKRPIVVPPKPKPPGGGTPPAPTPPAPPPPAPPRSRPGENPL